jgi:hypothetical protein
MERPVLEEDHEVSLGTNDYGVVPLEDGSGVPQHSPRPSSQRGAACSSSIFRCAMPVSHLKE